MSNETNLDELEAKLALTRESIAKNIDLIVEKTSPKNILNNLKTSIKNYISLPVVYVPLVGMGVLVFRKILKNIFKR